MGFLGIGAYLEEPPEDTPKIPQLSLFGKFRADPRDRDYEYLVESRDSYPITHEYQLTVEFD